MMGFDEDLSLYISENTRTYIDQLQSLVRIPSISANTLGDSPDKERKQAVYDVLTKATEILTPIGFTTKIVETQGNPILVAQLEVNPHAPWVTIYNHMDVQPAAEPEWKHNPFEPFVDEEKIYGRGTTDDKGPALTTVYAIDFLKKHNYELPNIQIIYETEEEIGCVHFGEFLASTELKKPASILVSDTIFEGAHPTITFLLRGMVRMFISLKTGSKELHSGLYGGSVKNPANILTAALATCFNEKGEVTIPKILEDVKEISPTEQAAYEEVAKQFDSEHYKESTDDAELYDTNPLNILLRSSRRPTFEIHGFEHLQSTPGEVKTALPSQAVAKVTMRLVPGLEPESVMKNLEEHLQKTHPGITVEGNGVSPSVIPLDSQFIQKAVEACSYGFEKSPLFVGAGGTIGSIPQFQKHFQGVPIVMLAQSLMEDGYHAPNESFKISQAQKGIKTCAKYLNSIATLS